MNTLNEGWKETKTGIIENGSDLVQITMISNHEKFMNKFCCKIKKRGYDTGKILFGEFNTKETETWVKQLIDLCFKDKIPTLILRLKKEQLTHKPKSSKNNGGFKMQTKS
jgi:hypothetical protein